jgi:hypothetical protein
VAAGARLANAIVVALLTVPTTFAISGAGGDVGDTFIVRRVYELLFEGVSIAGILLRMAVSMSKDRRGLSLCTEFSWARFVVPVTLHRIGNKVWRKGVDWRFGLTLLVTLQVLILNFD